MYGIHYTKVTRFALENDLVLFWQITKRAFANLGKEEYIDFKGESSLLCNKKEWNSK